MIIPEKDLNFVAYDLAATKERRRYLFFGRGSRLDTCLRYSSYASP
jgi:hypothetical protein